MKAHFIRPEEYIQMPWKNGGGSTRELFSQLDPTGNWLWRISVAEVSTSGPFSQFPHYDRFLCLLSGRGMRLNKNSGNLVLDRVYEPISFAGEEEVHAELIDGTNTDFNVFWRRDLFDVEVQYYGKNQSHNLFLKSPKQTSFFIYELESQYSHYITPQFENDSAIFKFNSELLLVSIRTKNLA